MRSSDFLFLIALSTSVCWAAPRAVPPADNNVPQASISNGEINAKLYLPDAAHGYYQGLRFDWSGVVASLEYKNHNYFGVWFPEYDPKRHDAITGPVEEFGGDEGGLGYNAAKPGETFVKIGVGVLRKPSEKPYRFVFPYEAVDLGKWTVRAGKSSVKFRHVLDDHSGYAYRYEKTVSLAKGKPRLILDHHLKNTGKRVIDTSVYDHDFYVIDGQPTGPDVSMTFPFQVRAAEDLKGNAEARSKRVVYLRELQTHESAASDLEGFSDNSSDYDIRVENRKTGAGVRQTSDHPLSKLHLWSIRTTVCPEGYIHLRVEPGREIHWRIAYDFYTVEAAGN